MYEGINTLWVSCVSRWGCLSDSVFSVFANPECICSNKKIFDWERGREREHQDAEHSSPGATHLLYLTCARTHAGVFDFTIFSCAIVWNSVSSAVSNSQSPRYSETRMTRSGLLNFCRWLESGKKNQFQRWLVNMATCLVSIKNILRCCSALPVTAFNTWYSRKQEK